MATLVLDGEREEAVAAAASLLREGRLVAFPTETVYGLGADARRDEALAALVAVKGRPEGKPLMLHVDGVAMARSLVRWNATAERLARAFWPGPLTLILDPVGAFPAPLLGEGGGVAVRAPAHSVALALIGALGAPVAGTSANRAGRPSPTTAAAVLADLAGAIDAVLDAGPTPLGMESTVLDVRAEPPRLLRPGAITREELEAAGGCRVAGPAGRGGGRILVTDAAGRPIPVLLFAGEPATVRDRLREEAVRLVAQGRRVGFLGSVELADLLSDLGLLSEPVGPADRPAAWGTRLFAALRALGEGGVDVILAEEPRDAGGAAAVRDRLRRMASEVRILR